MIRRTMIVLAVAMSLAGAVYAGCQPWKRLSGFNTVDYIYFSATNGDVVDYSIEGTGPGSNELRFKVQQKEASGSWTTIASRTLTMPSGYKTGTYTVRDCLSSSTENLRYRASRSLGTKRIYWQVCDW